MLNYLGYSWIDQGIHLDEGFKMLRRPSRCGPRTAIIVDSLGWAHFKLGDYDEAVQELERAVSLKPADPTINDHLGDAYWRIGRKLEAQFQWNHARDLNPDPDDLPKILAEDQVRPAGRETASCGRHQDTCPTPSRRRTDGLSRRMARLQRPDRVA